MDVCKDCKWWEGIKEFNKVTFGECRRYPPQKFNINVVCERHNISRSDDWCGEFEAKDG